MKEGVMYKRILLAVVVLILFLPLVSSGNFDKKPLAKLSFDFVDADVKNVLKVLAEISGKNIIVAEDVKGKITIRIDNITWEEALDVLLKNHQLSKIEDENVIRIVTQKRYFEEKELDRKERLEFLREKEAKQRLEEDFITETLFINYVDAAEVEKMIRGEDSKERKTRGLLSQQGAAILVKWTNALILKDTRENIEQIKMRVREHDVAPPQIQIEARIVEANTDFQRELGVKWNWSGYSIQGGWTKYTTGKVLETAPSVPSVIDPKVGPYQGLAQMLIGSPTASLQLDAILRALESDGRGKIISNPKVVTSDNQPAKITQGTQIPYQTVSQSGTQTEFKDAVLSLEVTPHYTKDGNISMKIKATKDKPTFLEGYAVPSIDKKEANTMVLIKDGETVVIGGIYEIETTDTSTGVPLLRNVPLLGWLFKTDKKIDTKKELLIFITPNVVKNKYEEVGVK
jgi:type IV pilus assembly protein PilQ